ncbi:hypothetical protein Pint_09269 [Pistacia integerrima]|uniref:Uncharacterized protein n=1 Tax=Pistacia integerrima TaxID=434235 RepID=A0ACC0XUV3_9ROSI|nr:hypothetical protein Pint_09269 [Pistacia integerrima]
MIQPTIASWLSAWSSGKKLSHNLPTMISVLLKVTTKLFNYEVYIKFLELLIQVLAKSEYWI